MDAVIGAMFDTFHGLFNGTFTFRGPDHLSWLIFSMIMFLIVMFLYIAMPQTEEQGENIYEIRLAWTLIFFFFAAVWFMVSCEAYQTVIVQHKFSKVYSIDCVWFNALMAAIYVGFGLEEIFRNSFILITRAVKNQRQKIAEISRVTAR